MCQSVLRTSNLAYQFHPFNWNDWPCARCQELAMPVLPSESFRAGWSSRNPRDRPPPRLQKWLSSHGAENRLWSFTEERFWLNTIYLRRQENGQFMFVRLLFQMSKTEPTWILSKILSSLEQSQCWSRTEHIICNISRYII